jgi:hypothetical protein
MKTQQTQAQSYQNVMEVLVAEEVTQQLRRYPPNLANCLNKTEIETYALNRLPPFYASCTEGWRKQKQRAESEFKDEIRQAVRQGFAAVQRDPLRISTPIALEEAQEYQRVRESLLTLQELLQPDEPSWASLARVAKRMLARTQLSKQSVTRLTAQPTDRWTELHQNYRY